MKTASEFSSPPQDYNVIVPDGWFQLSLEPEERDRCIAALADLQFRGIDNAPHLREQFMRDVQRKAKDAYDVGGMELYLSTLVVGPVPLASSLLTSMPDPDEWPKCSDAEELAEHLAVLDGGEPEGELGVVALDVAGMAVRRLSPRCPRPRCPVGQHVAHHDPHLLRPDSGDDQMADAELLHTGGSIGGPDGRAVRCRRRNAALGGVTVCGALAFGNHVPTSSRVSLCPLVPLKSVPVRGTSSFLNPHNGS